MKVISLTAPYGTLIALAERHPDLGKHIETRGWRTGYRGRLAIHQAKGLGPIGGLSGLRKLIGGSKLLFESLMRIVPGYDRYCDADAIIKCLPLGKIIAACELVDCVPIGVLGDGTPAIMCYDEFPPYLQAVQEPEQSFGLYTPGRWAWPLSDIRALPEPIPAKGKLSLWDYEGELPL